MQDATVQSTPQTSQAPSAVAPSSYVVAAPAAAPAPAAQAPAPVAYQVGTSYPQAVPQAAPSFQSAPTQYAPQSQPEAQNSPWESAFNKVVGLLSQPVQSPFQAQPSQAPTAFTPANFGQQSAPATQQSVPQTWSPSQESSPSSSQTSSNLSLEQVADLVGMSAESRQVMDAFGIEAPALLNNYAVQLEAMVDSAVEWGNKAADTIKGYADFAVNEHQENLAYNEILTNPDVLSDYTLKFFGPEGPYPVYESEGELETKGYPTAPVQQNAMAQLGQMPAPPQAEAPQAPENFWGTFSEQMARDPQNAWRTLNQAQPQTVANKLFVME